jgi:hypothetical protein
MPTKRCRSCLRFGRRKRLDPAPPRLVNTASIERPVFIEINPAGVLRLAAPILYAWPSRAALGRGTTKNDTTTHGQHRRYRLLSRRIPSSRCQSNRRILVRRNPYLFEVWTAVSAAGSRESRSGGARRDRTDDLLLAKQALSQLSYGPVSTLRPVGSPPSRRCLQENSKKLRPPREWWAWKDLNFRPHAYQARALTN